MLKSMVLGVALGATAGLVVIPQLDKRTQKKLNKTSKKVVSLAEDTCGNIINYIKE